MLKLAVGTTMLWLATSVAADGITPLDKVEVTGHYDNSVGSSDAASEGVITPQLIDDRPLLRPGNLLEYVPGMVVTQHSGAGKANQYFLRGFNLDHGTDFATWVAGMPVNLRTHGHGQGYTDLNFIIPELISRVDYWKGPYYANIGDFGSAGGAAMHYTDNLKQGIALGTGGDFGYARALLARLAARRSRNLHLRSGIPAQRRALGEPRQLPQVQRALRYVMPAGDGNIGVTAMAYGGRWNSTDQIAQRAVEQGLIGRFGTLDASDGGESQRYSLSLDYADAVGGRPVPDHRLLVQVQAEPVLQFHLLPGRSGQWRPVRAGRQSQCLRLDGKLGEAQRTVRRTCQATRSATSCARTSIDPVGLYSTVTPRSPVDHARGRVDEGSVGIYAQNDTQWNDWFRSIAGSALRLVSLSTWIRALPRIRAM